MNRLDIEFWNSSLKSTILIKKEIEKLLDVCNENEKEKYPSLRIFSKIHPCSGRHCKGYGIPLFPEGGRDRY